MVRAAPAPFPERGFLLGRLSNAGLTVPRAAPRQRPASETLHQQDLAADSLRSSNPHRSHERRQRLFLNAVSSLGGFRTPASPCLVLPRARGRRPKPFTIAVVHHNAILKNFATTCDGAAGAPAGSAQLVRELAQTSPS